ncbi:MAG: HAD-IB family hydrolase [Patescibacteria group bacterium]
MKKVAIFDIDGTIFRSSLTIELVNALIEKEIFPRAAREEFEEAHKKWLDREGEYDAYITAVVAVFMKYLKGVYYGDFKDAAEEVIGVQQNHVYRYTRDLIKTLKADNYYLLAISHSPKAILDSFCKRYGFDKVYGKLYETGETGKFTGHITDEHLITNKTNIVRRAVEKEGLTLDDSIGVGDTESDIPFLEMVTRPICFNPNSKLYRYAKLNGWKVVVERKDVVYEL